MTENQREYQKYLKSDIWQQKRKELAEFYGHKCVFCKREEKLHLHHFNYDCLGKETFRDVVMLCKGCHLRIHKGTLKVWIFTKEEYEAFQSIKHVICDNRNKTDYMTLIVK